MVVDPNREDFERYLLASLIDEMNNLFLLSLAMDFVCDRFLEEEMFDKTMNSMALVLVDTSHLRNLVRFFNAAEWQVYDLSIPGRRISEQSIQQKTAEIAKLGNQIELKNVTAGLQLYNNSVHMVGGASGTKSLPTWNASGNYHMNVELVVADKAGVKDLSSKLVPLNQALSGTKKLFLSPPFEELAGPLLLRPESPV
jgi:hypothetical protein